MKSFDSLYGERKYNGGGICWSSRKEDMIKDIEGKWGQDVKKSFQLFNDRSNRVIGWLIFTKTRIIFYLQQDINKFKDFKKIVWVIDDLSWKNMNLKKIEENEIELLEGKSILFNSEEISAEKLIQEINSHIRFRKLKNIGFSLKKIRKCFLFNENFWNNGWVKGIGTGIIVGVVLFIIFK